MTKISYQPIEHNKQNRILVKFEYNDELTKKLRETTDAKWSKTLRAWHIADTELHRIKCNLPVKEKVETTLHPTQIKTTKLSENNNLLLKKFIQQLQLKAYSKSTINLKVQNLFLHIILLKNAI